MKSVTLVIDFKPYEENFQEVCRLIDEATKEYNKYTTIEVCGHSITSDGYGNANLELYFNADKVRYCHIKRMCEVFDYWVTTHDCTIEVTTKDIPAFTK